VLSVCVSTVNLLDFGSPTAATQPAAAPAASFDAFSGSNWAGNSGNSSSAAPANDWGQFASAHTPAPASSSGGAFFADFGTAPAPAPAASTSTDGFGAFAVAPPPSNDGFGAFTAAPAPAPTAPASFDPFAPTPSTSTAPSSAWGLGGAQSSAMPLPARSGDFSAFDALAGPAHGHQQQPHMHRAYGHGMHNVGMSANPMGMNAMGHMGHGQMGGMHGHMMGGGNAFAQHPRPMAGGVSASIGASSHRSGGYASGGNPGARDPFAGLGLPQ
jgi:hypothetical protein